MWSLCFSGSGACSGQHQAALSCQPQIWIMYTAIKYPAVVSAWGKQSWGSICHPALARGVVHTGLSSDLAGG